MKYPCDVFDKYGQWKRNHNYDGYFTTSVKCLESKTFMCSHQGQNYFASKYGSHKKQKAKPKAVSLNMATLTGSSSNNRI